jgi:hypothetical protein
MGRSNAVKGLRARGTPARSTVVHLVAGTRSSLGRAIDESLPTIAVRAWSGPDSFLHVERGDLVLIDLADPTVPIASVPLERLLKRTETWLLASREHPSSLALAALRPPRARVFLVESYGNHHYGAIVDKLRYRLGNEERGNALSASLLVRQECLVGVADLVKAICTCPKTVRRPRDLSAAVGLELETLRSRVGELGFCRIEHFIIAVKMVALEQLSIGGIRHSAARAFLGLDDSTNARRQFRRATARSKEGLAHLSL